MMNPWRNKPIHWFYVFVEHGLLPEIIDRFYNIVEDIGCRVVVDPFVGGNVVGVEGILRGFNVVGIDSNPWSLIVSIAKTMPISNKGLIEEFEEIYGGVKDPFIPSDRLSKYHRRNTLIRLGLIRSAIEEYSGEYKPLLLTLFGSLVEEYSLLYRSPAPRYGGRPRRGDPLKRYISLLHRAVDELTDACFKGTFIPILGDSSEWLPDRICGLLTSPPFANNIDYIRHTQLQLLWSGLARDSGDLGFWRSLQIPACQAASRSWKKEIDDPLVNRIIESMSEEYRRRYSRFLRQYIYYMYRHLDLVMDRLEGVAWYTIGDSYLGNIYVPTHRLLAKHVEERGLRVTMERIGDRYSRRRKTGLYLVKITSPR